MEEDDYYKDEFYRQNSMPVRQDMEGEIVEDKGRVLKYFRKLVGQQEKTLV
jgi:hypothetical protein